MQPLQINLRQYALADSVGLFVSIACAIHCAAMPLAVGYLPLLGLTWLADETCHQIIVVVCFGLAAWAFASGWEKHRSLAPAMFEVAGISLLSITAFCLEVECCPSDTSSAEALHANTACSDDPGLFYGTERIGPREPQVSGVAYLGGATAPLLTLLGSVLLGFGHVANHLKPCGCSGERCCLLTQGRKEKR